MEENKRNNFNFNFWPNKKIKWLIFTVLILILLIIFFKLGVYWGYKKNSFSYNWCRGYQRNFDPGFYSGGGFNKMRKFDKEPFLRGYGISGKIVLIKDSGFVLEDSDGIEKIILVFENTILKKNGLNIKFSDLKEGDFVVILGKPNQNGEIEAKLIRVF